MEINKSVLWELCYKSLKPSKSYSLDFRDYNFILAESYNSPITVAARSMAWTVFALSKAGIVASNPTQGIDICIVCLYSVFMLSCVQVAALRRADLPSKKSYRLSTMVGTLIMATLL
jgi:hypothetical protein